MTVPYGYTADLWNLFWRWRGSVWKKCAKPYVLFISSYYAIFIVVHYLLPSNKRDDFQRTVLVMSKLPTRIPIQFLLGFYINWVLTRWWDQLLSITYPDKFLFYVNAHLPGREQSRRIIRRTFARLAVLQCLQCWKEVSLKVRRRFPTTDHLRDCGIMTSQEFEMYSATDNSQGRWFLPSVWMNNLAMKLYVHGDISERALSELTREICRIRSEVGMLCVYDWVNLPMVYAQVAKLVTYGYFLLTLVSQQPLSDDIATHGDFGLVSTSFPFPLITSLEFLFYIGWLKVGDEILSPFGDRDEDFDMNYVVDRNMQISFMIVDSLAEQMPSAEKDKWWWDGQRGGERITLPHTRGSRRIAHTDYVPEWNYDPIFIADGDMCWEDGRRVAQARRHHTDMLSAHEIATAVAVGSAGASGEARLQHTAAGRRRRHGRSDAAAAVDYDHAHVPLDVGL